MLQKGGSQLRVGRENLQHYSRTSWVQTPGVDLPNIPQIEWTCPPQFTVDPNWKMEAGSESQEMHSQFLRETRIAEAIYLRYSDIPANPSIASDAYDFNGDDSTVPLIPLDMISEETSPGDGGSIPLTPVSPIIEVEETATQPPTIPAIGPPVDEKPEVGSQPLLQRDEVTGTAVALVALIKSKEPGSKIDLELLIQLLRNPGMLEKLMKEHGLSSAFTSQSSIIIPAQPQVSLSIPLPIPRPTFEIRSARSEPEPVSTGYAPLSVPGPKMVTEKFATAPVGAHNTWSPSVPFAHSISQDVRHIIDQIHRDSQSQSDKSMPVAPMASLPSSSNFDVGKVRKLINEYGDPSGAQNASSPSAATTGPIVLRDENYYRRLILQHGTMQKNPSPQESVQNSAQPRLQEHRPCIYFNSPRGCRHGSNCRFQHVTVNLEGHSWAVEEPGTKRMKASGGNFGKHT